MLAHLTGIAVLVDELTSGGPVSRKLTSSAPGSLRAVSPSWDSSKTPRSFGLTSSWMASAEGIASADATPVDQGEARDGHEVGRSDKSKWRVAAPRIVAAGVLALVVILIAIPFWPGRMDADTLNEISDAMTGTYSDEHAPILEAIWHPFIIHGVGPAWVLTGTLVLLVVSLYMLLRLVARPVPAALIVLVICLSPPVYGQLGRVGRDDWYLALLLASFACASRYISGPSRFRWLWLVGTVAAAWFCQAARQNAALSIIIPLALVAAPTIMGRAPRLAARRWLLVLLSLIAGGITTLAIVGTEKLADHAIGVVAVHRAADLYVYDLGRLSRVEHRNLFPASVVRNRALAPIEAHFSNASMVAMIVGPGHPVPFPYTEKEYSELRHAWLKAITGNPGDYLSARVSNFLEELNITASPVYPYHLVIDGNPWNYHTTFPWANRIANDYEKPFVKDAATIGGVLYTAWPYLLACLIAVILAVVRPTARSVVFGAIALSTLTYQVSLAFALMGLDYRFEFPSVVIGLLVTAAGLCVLVQRLRQPRASRVSHPTTEPARLSGAVSTQGR